MTDVSETIKSRTSANHYDPARKLSDEALAQLIELATCAPSAFNAQNWKFVAVRSDEAQTRLLPLAYNQPKVLDAAVTFIVCGTLQPHLALPGALQPAVDVGILDEATFNGWVGAANGMYKDNATLQRDEAVRSAAMAAMTLMLAAQGKGMVSYPMIGFDAVGVADAFALQANEIPVMLLTVGYAAAANWPQKPRKDVAQVLSFA
ncbi:nitroreductase family protein [Delftia sp. PS-11]|uniref:nitroreductase family protein n=1 Tax=Delftia sp. PS-11 TaxID=2767222 RepID=UPI002458BA56|nr:nitroreductase family protein [Delftia sp. PS-11]KAJ8744149.1 nitroreductase family protein [Delftia sp. PS-11]